MGASKVILALAAIGHGVLGFVPSSKVFPTPPYCTKNDRTQFRVSSLQMANPSRNKNYIDVSIDYDAAAKLAYQEWKKKHNKDTSKFDPERFEIFKSNYVTLTIANVKALKKARDSNKDMSTARRLDLNDYADLTPDEYMEQKYPLTAAFSSFLSRLEGGKPEEKKKALPKAKSQDLKVMDNAMNSAFQSSSAAQDKAAWAIEAAAEALARDEEKLAKQLGLKNVEELEVALDSREGIAQDGGELDLNNIAREARVRLTYLDWCREYGKQPDEDRFPTFSNNFLAMEEFAKNNNRVLQLNEYADCTQEEFNAMLEAEEEEEAKAEADAKKKAKEEEEARRSQRERREFSYDERRKQEEEFRAAKEKADAEAAKQAEQERKDRANELERRVQQQASEAEAAAIRAAKAQAQAEAAQNARRRQIDAQAADLVRQQAKEYKAKIAELQGQKPEPPKPKKGLLDFLFGPMEPVEDTPKTSTAAATRAAPAPKKQQTKASPKKSQAVAKEPETPSVKLPDLGSLFSSLGGVTEEKKPATPARKGSATRAPAAKASGARIPLNPKAAASSAKKSPPAPEKKSPVFSFFGGDESKVEQKPKTPASAKTPAKPATSFFGGTKSAKKATPPAPEPAKTGFSFFGGNKPSPPAKVKPAPSKAKAAAPEPKKTSYSMFGGGLSSSATRSIVQQQQPSKIEQKKQAVNYFYGGTARSGTKDPVKPRVIKDNIPQISDWTQDRSGCITGIIKNSRTYSNGSQVTTSPVRRGVKKGTVVTTSSGSQYRLM